MMSVHSADIDDEPSIYGYRDTEAVHVYNPFLYDVEKPQFLHHHIRKVKYFKLIYMKLLSRD